jgi:hypothetical protein
VSLQREWRRDTTEYVEASYVADVNLTGLPVAIAICAPGATPVWLPATFRAVTGASPQWSAVARTNDVVTFSAALYPRTTYEVLVKLTDTPEVPIVRAYLATITG